MEKVFFRFNNVSEDNVKKFAEEVTSLKKRINRSIVKVDITKVNTSNIFWASKDDVMWDVNICFNTLGECREFNEIKELPRIYQKYSDTVRELAEVC